MSASAFNTLAHLDVENRRVLVRLDLDQDDALRVGAADSSLSTLKELLHRGARVILAGHRSARPGDPKLPSLRRVGSRLAQALECPVQLPDEVVGDGARKLIRDTRGGQIVLLENLELDPREVKDSAELGRQLADLCDVFVLDAVEASLDARASTTQLAAHMPEAARGIGHRLEAHLDVSLALHRPDGVDNTLIFGCEHPDLLHLAALAKLVETRDPKDPLVLAGPWSRTFAHLNQGQNPEGLSHDTATHMRAILDKIRERQLKLILPRDVEMSAPQDEDPSSSQLLWGPQSRRDLIASLHMPRVVWVGPLGLASGHQDAQWLGQRLRQHERSLIAVGKDPLTALAHAAPQEQTEDPTTAHPWVLGTSFVLARLARAPIPGLGAVAVVEQNHE